MQTDALIRDLGRRARPIRRLPPPWRRVLLWLGPGLLYLAFVVLLMSPRGDLLERMTTPRFLLEELGALTTAVAAAGAAFGMTIPGRRWQPLLLVLVPLTLWIGSLGFGCVEDWVEFGPEGPILHPDWACFPAMALVGLVPGIMMVAMLRRGAPLYPHATVALGALAVAALGDFGLRLFHQDEGSLAVLVWQFGSVVAMSAIAAWAGRQVLRWRHGNAA